jgi:protein ImuB
MLWIAIHLPSLPLEAFPPSSASVESWAIAENGRVLVYNAAAQARGVQAGMQLSAACALAPELKYRARDPAAEAVALETIALWAGRYTPNVSLEPPQALVLDIEGSLKLLGGMRTILRSLKRGLQAMHFSAALACAPNAAAALLLARGGRETIVNCGRALEAALSPLPPATLECDAHALQTFDAIGVSRLGDLLALPRAGVARRFGQALVDQLDRALGHLPGPRRFYTPPASFRVKLELAAPVADSEALLFATKRLLTQLAGFLAARNGGIQRCVLTLLHEKSAATDVPIGLVTPTRDATHLLALARERLTSLELHAPVWAIELAADEILLLAGENRTLFADCTPTDGEWEKLVERLRARLGAPAVHGVAPCAEHRPERAWKIAAPGAKSSAQQGGARPLWLLEEPQALPEIAAKPHYRNSPLALLAGPERIEAGWWDDDPVKRDYFVARSTDWATLWIYRERRRPGGWYLHGIFG